MAGLVVAGAMVVRLGAGFVFVVGWVGELPCMVGCWSDCCSRMMAGVVIGVVMVIGGIVAGKG